MDETYSRTGLLGRFAPPTEAEYQHWLIGQLRPIGRVVCIVALVGWVFNPMLLAALSENAHHTERFYLFAWGVAIPIVLLTLLNLSRPEPIRLILTASAGLVLIYLGNVLAFVWTVPRIDAGSFMFGITLYCMLAVVLHLPFWTTFCVSALVTTMGLALAYAFAAGPPVRLIEGPNASLPLITLGIVPGVALLTEKSLRDRFVGERVIEHQRQQLDESRLLIRRYAPSSVVSRIELGDHTVDHPQRRKVTVFFSDVVGFTSMADRVDPEALAVIVNDYLGALSEVIERHGGTLNEFAGDGVMALFGAPDELDPKDQVLAAIATGQELQRSLPEWSRTWYQHGIIEDPQARVGINTGTISVGTFGSAIRATYTGIGLQTNIAARVQAEAKPGGILLSNTSWHLIKDDVACEPRGEVMVKGVHFPIELYEPLD